MGVNIDGLKDFKKKVETSMHSNEWDAFMEECCKELAARLLAKVIKRTPVGQYPQGSGKTGGTLRKGWTGGSSGNGKAYAQSLKMNHFGNTYVIEIINPVEYAQYVEFGHRTRGGNGWVEGKFMMTISEQEIQAIAPKILEAKLKRKLGDIFG